jgi:hypothetical protein
MLDVFLFISPAISSSISMTLGLKDGGSNAGSVVYSLGFVLMMFVGSLTGRGGTVTALREVHFHLCCEQQKVVSGLPSIETSKEWH